MKDKVVLADLGTSTQSFIDSFIKYPECSKITYNLMLIKKLFETMSTMRLKPFVENVFKAIDNIRMDSTLSGMPDDIVDATIEYCDTVKANITQAVLDCY